MVNVASWTAPGSRPAASHVGVGGFAAQAMPGDGVASWGRARLRPGLALEALGKRLVAARPRVMGCSGQTRTLNSFLILIFWVCNFYFIGFVIFYF